MRELLKSPIPSRSTASFASRMTVFPPRGEQRPFREAVRLTTSGLFPMFDAPFLYGGPWDSKADAKPEAVAVISSASTTGCSAAANSVGRTLRLENREFRVVGVLDHWRPRVRAYDLITDPLAAPEARLHPPAVDRAHGDQPRRPGSDDLAHAAAGRGEPPLRRSAVLGRVALPPALGRAAGPRAGSRPTGAS